jgi:hypothetical protein
MPVGLPYCSPAHYTFIDMSLLMWLQEIQEVLTQQLQRVYFLVAMLLWIRA